ncbi:hypothetical protein A8B75_03975 [Sphingomonadales bacterium EhC05]|nr:hypothetical protein A8B75_03975 [Sphingomonadales bacterium EhC05]
MQAYLIEPSFEMYRTDDNRTEKTIELISKLVFDCLRSGGDNFQFSVDWVDPGEQLRSIFREDVAQPHVTKLEDSSVLMDRLRQSIDPNDEMWCHVRSIATCRTVTFGYDGQAFLCLRHEDNAPISPDQDLVVISEISNYLSETDYFDGWIRESS